MKFIERIKTLKKRSKSQRVDTAIIFNKQCPHCASKGIFVFNNYPNTKTKIGESNEKHK